MREGEPKKELGEKYYKYASPSLPPENKESLPVKIVSREEIGKGGFGDVFSIEAHFDGRYGSKKRNYAIKIFHSEEDAQNAFEHFKELKERGLKTFATYRLGEDKKSILMTNGNKKDVFLMSPTNAEKQGWLQDWFIKNPIIEIANFEQFADNVVKHTRLAASKNIMLPYDSYFFSISNTGKPSAKNLDFVIGDLDKVFIAEIMKTITEQDKKDLLHQNITESVEKP